MHRVALVVIADRYQFPPAVFLATRIASLLKGRAVDVVLASDDAKGLSQAREFGAPLVFLDISNLCRDVDLPQVDYFTRATYLKVFIPGLLRKQYRRLLYLDVDIYPESDRFFDLFDLDMQGHAVGAVRDLQIPFLPNESNQGEIRRTLRAEGYASLGAKYLNGGVLLIDTEAYARRRIEAKSLQAVREKKLKLCYPDQTLLNFLLRGDWLELSPAFNMVTSAWSSPLRSFAPPVLVHFTGPRKPWHRMFIDEHPVRREIAGFLSASPWADFLAEANPTPWLAGIVHLPRPPARQLPQWRGESLEALLRYLRRTPFADVEAGITALNPSALDYWQPARPAHEIALQQPA